MTFDAPPPAPMTVEAVVIRRVRFITLTLIEGLSMEQ
jgi:hypothetical protein